MHAPTHLGRQQLLHVPVARGQQDAGGRAAAQHGRACRCQAIIRLPPGRRLQANAAQLLNAALERAQRVAAHWRAGGRRRLLLLLRAPAAILAPLPPLKVLWSQLLPLLRRRALALRRVKHSHQELRLRQRLQERQPVGKGGGGGSGGQALGAARCCRAPAPRQHVLGVNEKSVCCCRARRHRGPPAGLRRDGRCAPSEAAAGGGTGGGACSGGGEAPPPCMSCSHLRWLLQHVRHPGTAAVRRSDEAGEGGGSRAQLGAGGTDGLHRGMAQCTHTLPGHHAAL